MNLGEGVVGGSDANRRDVEGAPQQRGCEVGRRENGGTATSLTHT